MPVRKLPASQRLLPAWVWLALGILIGLGIATMTGDDEQHTDSSQTNTTGENQRATDGGTSAQRSFDFYTLLPELEVVIPVDVETVNVEKKSKKTTSSEHTRPGTKPVDGGYLLQVGSFQQSEEASSLKVHLSRLGVNANIQSVNVNDSTWYRVRIGPVDSRKTVEELRERLRENGIDAMLMQAKQ